MKKNIHPFVKEAAAAAKRNNLTRRDFFRYAAAFGVSISAAGRLIGIYDPNSAMAAAGMDWKGLSKESPFEIKNSLIQKARDACAASGCTMLNAGRGNPNFLSTTVRESIALLTLFAAQAARKESSYKDIGFRLKKNGLSKAFLDFLDENKAQPGANLLSGAMKYAFEEIDLEADDLVFQLLDGIQGDFYPDPPRIFPVTEKIVRRYLDRVVFSGNPPKGAFHLFATEGATAAMIYIFNTLKENMVLNPGDKVAIVTPIFSPYLELPELRDYELETVYVRCSESSEWQVPDSELTKLRDPKVKALYIVNPTNPTSVSLNQRTVKGMADVIRRYNPNMVIISDTVYASFVNEYNTLGSELPENILGVYSFSKYFGVTGWRLGVIMVHENNVVDRIIKGLPLQRQTQLDIRYRLASTKPGDIPFIERVEIDSRQVALAHTGGLSGPQQVAMCLFSLHELLDDDFAYKKSIMDILKKRWAALYKAIGLSEPKGENLTRYYALINLGELAESMHGKKFAEELAKGQPLEFLFKLAESHHIVCLPGEGFAGPRWSLRVSLANISENDCVAVGEGIVAVMNEYKQAMQ